MKIALHDKDLSTVLQNVPAQTAVACAPWRCPQITIIDVRRTMAALGAYVDGGTGSSF
jgi:hypothetical protein